MIEQIVRSELHLDRIADKAVRDVLRRAAKDAERGPVWIVRKDGTCIAALTPPDEAAALWLALRGDWDQLQELLGGLEDEKLRRLREAGDGLATVTAEILGRGH